jgi:transcriptional regulator with XRE-family HTH domain
MTPGELAGRLGVDPKTVHRWLTNGGRVPHARTRWAAAEELEVDEVALWPRAVRFALKTGPEREIEATYPTRSAMPRTVWQRLIGEAQHELVLCGFTSYFLWSEVPDLSAVLRAKAGAGVRVRFVLGDPDSANTRRGEQLETTPLSTSMRIAHARRELEPLRDVVEVRQSDLGWGRSVWRGDHQAVASWNVLGTLGHESPVVHLRRRQDGGLFDQIAVRHTEALWAAARPLYD